MNRDLPPQGDRFEDQYTAATADLSVGGVASAVDALQHEASTTSQTVATEARAALSDAQEGIAGALPEPSTSRSIRLNEPRTIGVGAGVLLAAGSAVGGAWLYSRWLQERNKPINRLRRGARDVASRLSERLPENVELPTTAAPFGGAASIALLSTLLVARAMRREEPTPEARLDQARNLLDEALASARGRIPDARVSQARSLLEDAMGATRRQAPLTADLTRTLIAELIEATVRRAPKPRDASRTLYDLLESGRQQAHRLPPREELAEPKRVGIGLGGMAAIAATSIVVWRLLRGGNQPASQPWYVGMDAPGI